MTQNFKKNAINLREKLTSQKNNAYMTFLKLKIREKFSEYKFH